MENVRTGFIGLWGKTRSKKIEFESAFPLSKSDYESNISQQRLTFGITSAQLKCIFTLYTALEEIVLATRNQPFPKTIYLFVQAVHSVEWTRRPSHSTADGLLECGSSLYRSWRRFLHAKICRFRNNYWKPKCHVQTEPHSRQVLRC